MCIALCWNVKLIYIIKLADSSGSVTSLQSKIQTKKSLPTQNTNPAELYNVLIVRFLGGVLGFDPIFAKYVKISQKLLVFFSILRKLSQSPKQISETPKKSVSCQGTGWSWDSAPENSPLAPDWLLPIRRIHPLELCVQ